MISTIDFEKNIGEFTNLNSKKKKALIFKKKILNKLERSGSIIIKKFPIERSLTSNIKNYNKLMSLLGRVLPQNKRKEKIVQIKDYSGKKWSATVRGYKTRDYLDFHSDGGSIAGLFCIRPSDEGGESTLIDCTKIYKKIKDKKLKKKLLEGFRYHTRKESSDGSIITKKKYPVFFKSKGKLCCMYNRKPIIEAAKVCEEFDITNRLLNAFDKYIYNNKKDIQTFALKEGDIWIVNNYKVLHGRKAFKNKNNKRLLLRAWVNPKNFKYSGNTILDAYNNR